jgi:hypothetical protein
MNYRGYIGICLSSYAVVFSTKLERSITAVETRWSAGLATNVQQAESALCGASSELALAKFTVIHVSRGFQTGAAP